jgi:hypothetical protein
MTPEALASAAKELGRELGDRWVVRLADLRIQYAYARQQWATAQSLDAQRAMNDASDRIDALLDKIKPADEKLQIRINYVSGLPGVTFASTATSRIGFRMAATRPQRAARRALRLPPSATSLRL